MSTCAGPRTADFAQLGAPCSIDISHIWRKDESGESASEELLDALVESLKMKRPALEDLLRRVEIDPSALHLLCVGSGPGGQRQLTSLKTPGHVLRNQANVIL